MHLAFSILLSNKTAQYNHAMGIYNDGNDASNVKFYHGIIVSHVISVGWMMKYCCEGSLKVRHKSYMCTEHGEWRETDTYILSISSWSVKQ